MRATHPDDRPTPEQLANRRADLWRELADRGEPTTLIARLFRVSERTVQRGIAKARELREALRDALDDRLPPTAPAPRAGLPA